MNNQEYTSTRVRKDVLRRLKEIAERNNRSIPRQIEELVEREERAVFANAPTPTAPEQAKR